MIRCRPAFRASLFQAFWSCLLALTLGVGLSFCFVGPAHAQSNLIIVQKNGATVRYREGIQFNVKASIDGSAITHTELKLKFGKKGHEETDKVDFANGSATFFVSEDSDALATGMPVSYSWVLTDGKVQLETSPQTVIYEDTTHTWFQVEGPKVTVRWYNGDSDYGQLMYQLASDALATYKRRFSMDPQDQIYITIYGSNAAYHSTFPDVPDWSGGFSKYGGVEIVAIAPQDHNASVFIGEGIPHELSHAALYQFLQGPAPRWLDEGFAVYNQNVISIKEYDDLLLGAYRNNSLIPLSKLDKRWPSDEDAAMLAYAEGRSIVTFLINSYGNEVWANVLDQLRRKDADGAFNAVFGVKLAVMEDLWKRSALGGQRVNLPTALQTGPVASQPSADDYSARTGAATIVTPGKTVAAKPQEDNGLFWVLIGVAVVAVLTLVGLSLLIVRNRRRETALERFRPAGNFGEIDVSSRLSSITHQGQTFLPSASAPVVRQPLPPAPMPVLPSNGWQSSPTIPNFPNVPPPFGQGNLPNARPVWSGYSQPQNFSPIPAPIKPQSGGADPFDYITPRFESKTPGAGSTTFSAGAFLDLDPYGLNFEPVKTDTKEKEKQV